MDRSRLERDIAPAPVRLLQRLAREGRKSEEEGRDRMQEEECELGRLGPGKLPWEQRTKTD